MNVMGNISESNIRDMVLDAYGKVEIYERAELDARMTQDGDIKMDSASAGSIIAKIETQLGRELPEPSDLRPEQFSSVNNIVNMITQKLEQGSGKSLKCIPQLAATASR